MIRVICIALLAVLASVCSACSDKKNDGQDGGLDSGVGSDGDSDTDTDTDIDTDTDSDADTDTDTDIDTDTDTDTDTQPDADAGADAGDGGQDPKGCRRYVDYASSFGSEDGTSWTDAYLTVYEGIEDGAKAVSKCPQGVQVWVAAGTYLPDTTGLSSEAARRTATLELVSGVHLYGGFIGTEAALEDRVPDETKASELSGDLNGDDEHTAIGGDFVNYNDNVYRVVTGADDVIMDGFTIRGGSGDGGGMHNHQVSPMVRNCRFEENSGDKGGGVYNNGASPTFVNCVFRDNRATDGAGMFNEGGAPRMINCTFRQNTATGNGGGIYNLESSAEVTNCILWDDSPGEIHDEVSTPNVTYSNVRGSYPGAGNIDISPAFIGDGVSTYPWSPCMDRGNSSALTMDTDDIDGDGDTSESTPMDLVGQSRILFGQVDMGAIENPGSNDCIAYVDGSVALSGDGASWATALKEIQEGINIAALKVSDDDDIDFCEVWVASIPDGVYMPTVKADGSIPVLGEEKFMTISLAAGIGLFGGFNGTETLRSQRNPVPAGVNAPYGINRADYNETILDGDLNGDDDGSFENFWENTCNVVTGADDSIIDGFTIRNGYSDADKSCEPDSGGGMINEQVSPFVTNCIFEDNYAYDDGGGIYIFQSSPVVLDCTLSRNSTGQSSHSCGGGMYIRESSAIVENCVFEENDAYTLGGGACNSTDSLAKIRNSRFYKNSSDHHGGGIYNVNVSADLVIEDSEFIENRAGNGGGIHNSSSSPTIKSCVFTGNSAEYAGGIYNTHSSAILTNCVFQANHASWGGALYFTGDGQTHSIVNCTFQGNRTIPSNAAFAAVVYSTGDSASTITNCIFQGNKGTSNDVWGVFNEVGTFTFSHTYFEGGFTSPAFDGVGPIDDGGNITTGDAGLANIPIDTYWTEGSGTNETVVLNTSDAARIADLETIEIGDDGVARTVSGTPSGGTVTFAPALSAASASGERVDHWGSNTNVEMDLSLTTTSACVDVGDDSAVPGDITTDIAGDSRFVDSPGVGNTGTDIVDMGAYEHQP